MESGAGCLSSARSLSGERVDARGSCGCAQFCEPAYVDAIEQVQRAAVAGMDSLVNPSYSVNEAFCATLRLVCSKLRDGSLTLEALVTA